MDVTDHFKKENLQICFGILLSGILLFTAPLHAAEVTLTPSNTEVLVGDEFVLDLLLDPEDEEVNAIDLSVSFDKDAFFVVDTHTGNSIISLWLEEGERSDKGLRFSGLIPGGYSGTIDPERLQKTAGLVVSIVFKAKVSGNYPIIFTDAEVLANDGSGTAVEISSSGTKVRVSERDENSPDPHKVFIDDTEPPSVIDARIYKDPSSGEKFLSFYAEDKGSGISHYEVKEGQDEWVRASNPHLLAYKGRKDIQLKAIDKAGNVDIVYIESDKSGLFITILALAAFLLVIILLNFLYRKFIYKFR